MHKRIKRRCAKGKEVTFQQCHPLLATIYKTRNVQHQDELLRELGALLSYESLLGIHQAVERLVVAIEDDERIMIVGDFDADGATSTAVAIKCLRAFGAKHVSYVVPNRFEFGYGLTAPLVELAAKSAPDLIVTVDNGIANIEGAARAKALGIDVIVTDHHLPADTLPEVVAIVNPNQVGDEFPCKAMAGVGVIFYVMIALRAALQEIDWFAKKGVECPKLNTVFDLVALGTIADVVPLEQNNRILIHQGLKRVRSGKACPGIYALLSVAKKDYKEITASDLAFGVAPRLNAAGRLDDMSMGIECLLSEQLDSAMSIAEQLNTLNIERKSIEVQMQEEAYRIIDAMDLSQNTAMGLCLYDPSWHQGVIGLLCSRVKEKYHRPVVAFSKVSETELKGSARSIPGLHIRDLLSVIDSQHPGLINKFGGHAMAAGLSLQLDCFEQFKEVFSQTIASMISAETLSGIFETDGELPDDCFTLPIANMLREGGPWGQGFPEPVFDGVFQLVDQRIVGERHLKMLLKLPGSQYFIDAIAFNVDTKQWPCYHCEAVQMVYSLDVNHYRDKKRVQLIANAVWPHHEDSHSAVQ